MIELIIMGKCMGYFPENFRMIYFLVENCINAVLIID
uniref:Bm2662 n=1 Tax=Brugia malayi TaxID=6279 RepID=A0A1I9GE96_BRUMA|nr:Bm2662 [Brugia malayi]